MEPLNPFQAPQTRAGAAGASSEAVVGCECGRSLPVDLSHAGTTIACECGRPVRVPSRSKLRESLGMEAYEAGPVDRILGMLRRGELPEGDRCAISGIPTDDVIDLYVEAERTHRSGDPSRLAWLAILSPILLIGLLQEPRPDVGRETSVPTPLRVAGQFHLRVRKAGQRALKRWLRTVPAYAELLDQYPRARVRFGDPRGIS